MKEILITSSALILLLLVLRRVFRGVLSRRVQYALWGLVLARLLIPGNLPAVDFSLLTATQPVQQAVEVQMGKMVYLQPMEQRPMTAEDRALPTAQDDWAVMEGNNLTQPDSAGYLVKDEDTQTVTKYQRNVQWETLLRYVWAAGMVLVGGVFLLSNLAFYGKVRRHRRFYGRAEDLSAGFAGSAEGAREVYLLPDGVIPSPCLFLGRIYLTPAAVVSEDSLRHVLAHELTHARHWDPLWALLRCVCLTIYWFDPLVWAAAACAKTDCELACDEGALARLGEAERIPYGRTLLSLIPVRRGSNPLLAATTMTSGKRQLRDRITRIAQKPRQLLAAALAAAVLAGIVSACTFTGGKINETAEPTVSPGPEENVVRALTEEELRWFNEGFFNGADPYEYNIRNQFANPINLYDRPEDINLYDLFYCEGDTPSDEELKAALGYDSRNDLPCPAFKLTTAEADEILRVNMGLTLAGTAQKGLDGFIYDDVTDAYYNMHGDTNYCGTLDFTAGTREGGVVKLYHNSNFSGSSWYCVTLEEQEDGSYWFVSNQTCQQPAIPTVLPSGEPETVISLAGLEPYVAGAVEVEAHPDHYSFNYETCYANWSFDGHHVMVYRAEDGGIYAAYEEENVYYVFAQFSFEDVEVFFYDDLFGRDGFYITYQPGANARFYATDTDYYYFDENGVLTLLARCHGDSQLLDLDGDGRNELIAPRQLFFQREGLVYEAWLDTLLLDECPELEYWGQESWDRYGRFLHVSGLTDWDDESGGAMWQRYLFFDGENILAYKTERTSTDHMVEGIDQGVPAVVVEQAKAQVEKFLVRQPDGTWVHAGLGAEEELNYAMDDWRIESFSGPYSYTFGDITVEGWGYNYEKHTNELEKVVQAGGMYVTEDGWVSPSYPGCDYVFFQRGADGSLTFLWPGFYQESMESVYIKESLLRDMEAHGMDVSPSSYAALEVSFHVESLSYGDEVTVQPAGTNGLTFGLDEYGGRVLEDLTDPGLVRWSRAEAPAQEPGGESVILRHSDWYDYLQFWADSDLVKYKYTNDPEPDWFLAESLGDKSDVFFYRSRPYYQVRSLYDTAEFERLRTEALAADARLAQDFSGEFKLHDWAMAWAGQNEAAHGQVYAGSSYAFSWQKVVECEVMDQTDTAMSAWYTLAFVPANEEAERSCWAGNTAVYEGDDPDVPAGALYYTRVLHLAKRDGRWSLEGYGTG